MRTKIKAVGDAVVGRGHEANGTVCQDKVFAKRFNKVSALIALSDGAGSASHSDLGAEYVVNSIPYLIHDKVHIPLETEIESFRQTLIDNLQSGLNNIAVKNNLKLKDLACTLLFVYIKVKRGKTNFLAGHIGDGVIVALEKNEAKLVSQPKQGEFANSTFFVTSQHAKTYLRLYSGSINGDTGFMLMSDGVAENLYRKSDGFIAPACKQMFYWGNKYSSHKMQKILRKNLHSTFKEMTRDDCSISMARITNKV